MLQTHDPGDHEQAHGQGLPTDMGWKAEPMAKLAMGSFLQSGWHPLVHKSGTWSPPVVSSVFSGGTRL